jgi:hypothetical protein
MIGIRTFFAFLGILLGLISGLQWGVPRGWLVAVGTTAGGAVGGGIGGCVFGWLLESGSGLMSRLSERIVSRHRLLGDVFRWSSLMLMIAIIICGGYLLLRALPRHYK